MSASRVHAFTDDALGTHDAVGLVEALHAREVSVPEVIEAAIARAEAVDAELNGIAFRSYRTALAEGSDPRAGFFAGVPTWFKDDVEVAGMPTMEGTDAWAPRPSKADGEFARMYLATGLVPLGKSRPSEFGFLPSAEHPRLGAVHCPWNPAHTAGGSSAGSAAMVAAGVVPLAHAQDGGGSIRIPAGVNGLVGLKPSRDRIPTDRLADGQPVRIVTDGVVTRSVRDTAAFLREAERIYRPLHLPPVGDLTRPGKARLKVGVQTDFLDHPASPEVAELTLRTAALLESLGHHVEEVEAPLPATFEEDFLVYWSTLALYLVRNGRRLHGRSWDPTRLDAVSHGLARHAARKLPRLPFAIARLRASRRSADRFLTTSCDVLLTPTTAAETPVLGHLDPTQDYHLVMQRLVRWMSATPWQNATGQPAISLPLATTAAGLPQGMMVTAATGREALLVELAYELEEASPFASIQA